MVTIRHKSLEFEWHGYPILCKVGAFVPLKLCYNGTVGWWVDRKTFLSYNQIKKQLIKTKKDKQ